MIYTDTLVESMTNPLISPTAAHAASRFGRAPTLPFASWLVLLLSLPAKAGTGRMRVWRELKALGCATLRDGVYLLPDAPQHAQALQAVAATVKEAQGSAELFQLQARDAAQEVAMCERFDRGADFAALIDAARELHEALPGTDAASAQRQLHGLERRYSHTCAIDYFAGSAQRQAGDALEVVRAALMRQFSPDEPQAKPARPIVPLCASDYHGRVWATRARPWADRLASAWLIRRHIDPQARFVWLADPKDCAPQWLGFDFDGARFSHVGARVTFETLLASFGLESHTALARLGALVHALDVGGHAVAEAPGVSAMLAGLLASEPDDDALLAQAMQVFDWLLQGLAGDRA